METSLNLSAQWQEHFQLENEVFSITEKTYEKTKSLIEDFIRKYPNIPHFSDFLNCLIKFCISISNRPIQGKLYFNLHKHFCNDAIIPYNHHMDEEEKIISNDDLDELIELTTNDKEKDLIFNTQDIIFNHEVKNPWPIQGHSLDCAAYYGSVKIFKYLLMNGMEPDVTTANYAVIGGNFEIIRIIQQKGVDFSTSIEQAICYHHQDIANWILTNYQAPFVEYHLCIKFFNEEILFYYISINNNQWYIKDFNVFNYIVNTFNSSLLEHWKGLVDDISIYISSNIINNIRNQRLQQIKFLIDCGADINYDDSCFLIYACRAGNYEIVKYLLEKGIRVDGKYKSRSANKHSLVGEMVTSGRLRIAELLLQYGAKFDKIDNCLTCQILVNNLQGYQYLIGKGANPYNGSALLDYTRKGSFSIMCLLNRTQFIDIFQKIFSSKYPFPKLYFKYEFLHAIKHHFNQIVDFLLKYDNDLTECIIEKPKNQKSKKYYKYTALGMAILSQNFQIVRRLINSKVINVLNINKNYMFTPLIKAIQLEHFGIVKDLIENGADVNLDYNGCLPLLIAVSEKHPEITKFLLIHGSIITNTVISKAEKVNFMHFIEENVRDKEKFKELLEQYKQSKNKKNDENKYEYCLTDLF